MLSLFHRLALRLHAERAALWGLAVLAVIAFVVTVFVLQEDGQRFTFAAVALLLWSVCLLTIANVFVDPPPVVRAGAGIVARAVVRLRRAVLWVMALFMAGLTGLVVFTTVRAVGLLVRSSG